ncbi:glycine zipper 2TM domain-containing protein [Phenylobacterium sp. LjRoot225]|uniref:glycine zipper 2TM domain-containing protein n=1 Tax=Phenylobacterium sp. LjRoot225 TaxID=3342285 RepID=UPI003ED0A065
MRSRNLITATVLAASAMAALPTGALAHGQGHHKHHAHYRDGYAEPQRYYRRESCRSSGTTGLIVGGAAGALLGRELDGGRDRATGTILGAGAGALLGREVSRKSRC